MKHWFILLCLFSLTDIASAQIYPVGVQTITYTDASRSNRSIPVEIHYPAVSTGANAALASDSFPFVVFGHGFVMPASSYYPFADSLAERGYIFAFPTTESSILPSHPNFAQDLIFVYNTLIAANSDPTSPLNHHVIAKGAIAGHSMGGGSTVLSASYSNPAVCYWTLAEATTNPSSITAAHSMTKPYLSLAGSYDCIAPYTTNQLPTYDSSGSPCKILIEVTGASHCDWGVGSTTCGLGETLSGCSNPPLSDAAQIASGLKYIEPYLDYYLKGICRSWTTFDSVYNADVVDTKTRSCMNIVPSGASISGPSYVCAGTFDTLTAQPSGFLYRWTSGDTTAAISISSGGSYDVTVGNGTCTISAPAVVETSIRIPPTPSAIIGPDSLCAGTDSALYTIAAVSGATSYQWNAPSSWTLSPASNTRSIYLSVNDSTAGISISASNICGISSSLSKTINITPLPQLTGAIYGTDSLCMGSSNQIYTFSGNTNAGLVWTAHSPYTILSGQNSDTIAVSGIDSTGTVSLIASNYCGVTPPVSFYIVVSDTPRPNVTQTGDTLRTNIIGTSYQWYMNGQAISGADSAYYIATSNGDYSVVVTNQNGCAGTSSVYSYTNVNTGLNGISDESIKVYPNPATGVIFIQSGKLITQVNIMNEIGEKIIKETGAIDKLDISYLTPDIYFVEVTTNDGQASFFKMIKK